MESCICRFVRADDLWKTIKMRTLVSLLTIAVSVYLLLALMIYLFQDRMVFLSNMPGRALVASPNDIGLYYQDVSLITSDNERLHGWYVPAGNSAEDFIGVLLFFHGNAGNISHRLDSIKIFHELGLDTLIIDYRGYGNSTGKASEHGTYLDAQAAWDYLTNQRGIPAEQIVIFGRSLGGAIGAWLGTQNTPAAVIIESGFTSGVDMARRLYPFLPARQITRIQYPVIDYAARLNCPVLVIHSRDDEIIPFDMGQAIYAALKQQREFLELSGDHNNGFLLDRKDYMRKLNEFTHAVLRP
jgi:fermentation-respiration switch protein FrsA (DUF1100 family)